MSLPFSLVAYLFATLAVAEPIDKALLWGPYRPNLYFGIRPRIPTGPIFGLMWGTTENGKLNPQTLRHACEQSDGMAGYGWTTYDARNGGVQTISDPGNTVNLTVEFAKFPDRIGDWSVRVRGVPLGDVKSWNISMIFYLGVENASGNESSAIQCSSTSAGAVSCLGDTPGLGQYSSLMPPPISKGKIRTVVKSMKVANDRLWEAKCERLISICTTGSDCYHPRLQAKK
jgi:mannosyl-oligosaccharide glucosidase